MSVNIRCYYKSGRNGQKKQKKGEREENTQRERGAEREKKNDTRKINTENTDLFEEFESLFFIQDWECGSFLSLGFVYASAAVGMETEC